jgi:hypothetical protein
MNAFVTLVVNNEDINGAIGLGKSLREKTKVDLICMVTPNIKLTARKNLNAIFTSIVKVDDMEEFTKWSCLNLKYDRVVMLDNNQLVLQNIDELFNCDTPAFLFNSQTVAPYGNSKNIFGGYFLHNERVNREAVNLALDKKYPIGTNVAVLKCSPETYKELYDMVRHNKEKNIDSIGVVAFYCRKKKVDCYNIHHMYSILAGHPPNTIDSILGNEKRFIPSIVLPRIIYYRDTKPWESSVNYPDMQLWQAVFDS